MAKNYKESINNNVYRDRMLNRVGNRYNKMKDDGHQSLKNVLKDPIKHTFKNESKASIHNLEELDRLIAVNSINQKAKRPTKTFAMNWEPKKKKEDNDKKRREEEVEL